MKEESSFSINSISEETSLITSFNEEKSQKEEKDLPKSAIKPKKQQAKPDRKLSSISYFKHQDD